MDEDLGQRVQAALERTWKTLGPEHGSALPTGEEPDAEASEALLDIALELIVEEVGARAGRAEAQTSELLHLLLEVVALQREAHGQRISRQLHALGSVQAGLSRFKGAGSVASMPDRATKEICRSFGFDRAILFRVERGKLIISSVFFADDEKWAKRTFSFLAQRPPPATSGTLEGEIIRRRVPILVDEPQDDPRVSAEFVSETKTISFAAAPITSGGRVIGILHADRYFAGRVVDRLDLATLWTFAEGFGYAVERTVMAERLGAQADEVRRALVSADTVMSELRDAEIELRRADEQSVAVTRAAAAIFDVAEPEAAALLTPREGDVMRLLAAGATNAAIAAELVISEATVKTHVKRILRKLRAANRAEAVARFVRLRQRQRPDEGAT